MDTTIKVTVRSTYGVDRYYPANTLAVEFAKLLGQSSFTRGQLERMKAMGFSIEAKTTQVEI